MPLLGNSKVKQELHTYGVTATFSPINCTVHLSEKSSQIWTCTEVSTGAKTHTHTHTHTHTYTQTHMHTHAQTHKHTHTHTQYFRVMIFTVSVSVRRLIFFTTLDNFNEFS